MTSTAPWRVALCAGGFAGSVAAAPHGLALAAAAAAAGCAAVACVFVDRRRLTALAMIVVCCAGAWRGLTSAAVDRGPGAVAGHLASGAVVLRGTVGDAGVPGRDDVVVVDVEQLASRSGSWEVRGAVAVTPQHLVSVLPGDSVEVQANALRAPATRPGALSVVTLEHVGVTAVASAATVTLLRAGGPSPARLAQQARRGLSDVVARVLPEPEATLLLGIAFGIHARLNADVRAPLQDSGLIHIVAVSGLKVVMIAGLVASLARSRGWPRSRRVLLTLGVVAVYIVVSGAGAAALRSGLMVAAGMLLTRDGRRPHSFALLSLCAAAMLGADPELATEVGFQLSFLGTAGILLLAEPLAARIPGPRVLADPFAVTVAAQLATAPVTAGTFGVLSIVGPLANALVLPLLPLAIVVGAAGAAAASLLPAVGWAPLQGGALVTRLVLAIARGAASMPFGAVHIEMWPWTWIAVELTAGLGGAMAWFGVRRRGWEPRDAGAAALATILVGAVGATTVASAASATALRLTVLDVGNGLAVLLRPPGGGAILVDGGSDGAALVTALGRVLSPLQRHLDAVVLTATDRSSAAAMPSLVGHYDVGTLVTSQPLPPALGRAAATMAGAGTKVVVAGSGPWTVGGITARCLASGPAPTAACVLQVTDGRTTALITGGLTVAAQDELAAIDAAVLRAQLLVAPTAAAPSSALLTAVAPLSIAVPAKRMPVGMVSGGPDIALTGRDQDLTYEAQPETGGWSSPFG